MKNTSSKKAGQNSAQKLKLILTSALVFFLTVVILGALADKTRPKSYSDIISNPNKVYELMIHDHAIVSGNSAITVKKGDIVHIILRTDKDEERIKLDGYNINTETDDTSTPGGFRFIADKVGIFKFFTIPEDNDGQSYQLGTIEVVQ